MPLFLSFFLPSYLPSSSPLFYFFISYDRSVLFPHWSPRNTLLEIFCEGLLYCVWINHVPQHISEYNDRRVTIIIIITIISIIIIILIPIIFVIIIIIIIIIITSIIIITIITTIIIFTTIITKGMIGGDVVLTLTNQILTLLTHTHTHPTSLSI